MIASFTVIVTGVTLQIMLNIHEFQGLEINNVKAIIFKI